MKKHFAGTLAVALAFAATAFTVPPRGHATLDPTFDWQVYDASGNPTSTFLTGETEAQVQHDNPGCNGSNLTCFREWNLGHTIPQNIYIKKP